MDIYYELPSEYVELGFNMSKFGDKSLALKHRDRSIFIFSSESDLRDDFVRRLCDTYLTLSTAAKDKAFNL